MMYEVDLSGFCRQDCREDGLAVGVFRGGCAHRGPGSPHTQNRDTQALQLKLDELLRSTEGARTSLVNLERLSDEELDRSRHEFERISQSRADRR
ncbi:MAG TPA: low affinity iron permease family protein [Thermoanaerobaculia bacterium]